MESYCSLCTVKVPQGANNLILCTLDSIHILFFVTRLIINQIYIVQWVDFKLGLEGRAFVRVRVAPAFVRVRVVRAFVLLWFDVYV
jgi:hypothetical protein